jgi:hypothetical protein
MRLTFTTLLIAFKIIGGLCFCYVSSGSQDNEENLVIKYFFQEKRNGVYVEMGALDGRRFTNTLVLDNCYGWKGILIEGGEPNFKNLQKNVAIDRPSAEVHWGAVCVPPQTHTEFVIGKHAAAFGDVHEISDALVQGFYEGDVRNNTKIIRTPCKPFSMYLGTRKRVDFFSLDVEGAELTVLETTDFSKVHFNVIMIEMDSSSPKKNYKLRQLMFNVGFVECLGAVPRSAVFLNKNFTGSKTKCPFETSTTPTPFAASERVGPMKTNH